jgi:class 3 adenylate cyclase
MTVETLPSRTSAATISRMKSLRSGAGSGALAPLVLISKSLVQYVAMPGRGSRRNPVAYAHAGGMREITSDTSRPGGPTGEVESLRARLEAVSEVLRALSRSGMALQPILDQIVEAAVRLGRADTCLIWLVDGQFLRLHASFGAPEASVEYQRLNPHTPETGSCTGRVALTKRPVHIPDVDADPDYTYETTQRSHYKTLLGLPILVEGELVGVFGLSRREMRPFASDEIELMSTFADQSAIAIATARLFETVERQKAELTRFLSPEVAALVSSEEGAKLLAGHRALITIVYFDLRGFTAFVETAEPEELIDVIGAYHAAAGELVRVHGGTVEHFAGDGLMVFLNDPVPIPDHELQAARLAIAMRDRFGELAGDWRKRGYELGLGAGIAVGHATLGRIGFEGRYDYGALGIVTALAARLSDQAQAGQILLSQRAHAALEGRVDARLVGELDVKGFARPVQAFELQGVLDATTG